jgi:hypothetical protein
MATPTATVQTLEQTLKDFFQSAKIRKDPSAVCKCDSFVKHFKDYLKEKQITLADPLMNPATLLDSIYAATGLTIERDTYRPYPGRCGAIHKSTWLTGAAIVADEDYAAQLEFMCDFLDPKRGVFSYDTKKYMKYADFLKCLDGYRLQRRIASFKPSARLLKDVCIRYNLALESSGVHDEIKTKWLLGLDFA